MQQKAALNKNEADGSEKKKGKIVTAPLVGTFYAAPAEDEEPFVKVGERVEKGQIVAIIEAMKLMNEIESDFAGTVTEVFVENGQFKYRTDSADYSAQTSFSSDRSD